MATCVERFERDPQNYENAKCIYALGRHRADRAQPLLQRLKKKHPDVLYLDVIQGHFARAKDLARARELYAAAALAFGVRGNEDGECIAIANLLTALYPAGQPEKIQEQLRRLAAIESNAKDPVARARAAIMIAGAKTGHYRSIGEQLRKLRSFSPKQEEAFPWSVRRKLLLHRGHGFFQMGDELMARNDAEALLQLSKTHKDLRSSAQAYRLLARILMARVTREPSRFNLEQAEFALTRALDSARAGGFDWLEGIVLFGLSALLVGQAERAEECLFYAERCIELSKEKDPLMHGRCLVLKSQVLSRSDPTQGFDLGLQAVHELATVGGAMEKTSAWKKLMQRAWLLKDFELSKRVSERALKNIEQLREQQAQADARRQVFSVWADDYYWLANQYLTQPFVPREERVETAFSLSERGRARTLHDSLRLGNHGGTRAVASISDVQAGLLPDEAMVLFQTSYRIDSEGEDYGGVWVFIVTSQSVQTHNLPLDRKQVNTAVRLFRGSLGSDPQDHVLQEFRRMLWEPISDQLAPKIASIVMVADGELPLVPWDLVDDTRSFSFSDSATSWILRRKTAQSPQIARGLAFVDPINSGLTDQNSTEPTLRIRAMQLVSHRLLHSRREAAALRKNLGDGVRILSGHDATAQALLDSWTLGHQFIHLAAHSARSKGEAAIALASSSADSSEWLTAKHIEYLRFDGALVVLAGCSTGIGEAVVGDGVLSLAKAFRRSGARAVIASLWPVDDRQSARFFEAFYESLGQGLPIGRAMKVAKERLKSSGAHASDYASFVVLGDAQLRVIGQPQRGWWTWPFWALFAVTVAYLIGLFCRHRRGAFLARRGA